VFDNGTIGVSYFNRWRWYAQALSVILVKLLGFLGVFRIHYRGRKNLPPVGQNCILVANHMSNWDPPMVAMAIRWRPIAFMAKRELFETFFGGLLYNALGTFSVNRTKVEKKTLKTARLVLKDTTWLLGMFPEGTRHKDRYTIGPIKDGAAAMAIMTGKPIIPIGIAILGNDRALVIGEMLPVPTSVDAGTEMIKAALLELKQQAFVVIDEHIQ
jgi:1-acyl-sn-glycerol-3-phosphate acyltransferase